VRVTYLTRYNPRMPLLSRRQLLAAAPFAVAATRLKALPLADFPLGVTTDEIDEDVLTAVKFLRRFDLRYAEVRSIWGKYNTQQPLDKVKEARAIFDEYQIKTSILGTPFFKVALPKDNAALDAQWKLLDEAMARAQVLGTDKMRVFAFTYKDGEQPDAAVYPRIYELVREAATRAKAKAIRLACENVGQSYVWSGAQAAELLKNVKNDNFGLTWDPNNAAQTGEHSYPEGFGKLDVARIFHVHLRDWKHRPDGVVEWAPVGGGEMDNLGQIRALRKAGYRGTYTLETHYRDPKGKAYATENSLTGLLKVIAQV